MKKAYAVSTKLASEAGKVFEIKDFGLFLSRILGNAIILAVVLTLAYLIWGAIDWVTSSGDQEKLKGAKNKITHAIIGLGLAATTWLIWRITIYFLGVDISGGSEAVFRLGG